MNPGLPPPRLSRKKPVGRVQRRPRARRAGTPRSSPSAVAALEASGLSFTPGQVHEGLMQTAWPGRFQIVNHQVQGHADSGYTGVVGPEALYGDEARVFDVL